MPRSASCLSGRRSPERKCACCCDTPPTAVAPENRSGACECARECESSLHWKRLSPYLFTSSLSGFLLETLAGVTNTLVLVRVRLLQSADVRRDLSDLLAVHTRNHQVGLLIDRDADAGRYGILDRMGEPQCEHHRILPLLGAKPDADNVEFLGESVSHSAHRIGDQRPGEPMESFL